MSNITKSAEIFSKYVEAFRCPHCKGSIKVVDMKSLICSNNHTFDFAKQGYVNLMTRSSNTQYNKELFEARQKVIMESNLYELLHEKIVKVVAEYMDTHDFSTMILDAGCGEGSHLQSILDKSAGREITGVGLDISKEGIVMAAKKYKEPIWIVGDLANSPLENQSFQVILNILSPSNYQEFKRVLVPNGLVIKVVPRSNYLKELREVLFENTTKKVYKNERTVELFKKHFYLKDMFHLSYSKELDKMELENLVRMSPLSWTSEEEKINSFLYQASSEISIDLDVLIGVQN